MRRWLIEKLGGYPDVDSALESIEDPKERTKILTLAVKRLYNTIGADDILRLNSKGQWTLEGKVLSEGRVNNLISEATMLLGTDLWKVLQLDIKYRANRKMYTEAKNEDGLTFGKMWLYTLDAIATRLVSLKSKSALYNSKEA